jgi:hypothetical protein
VLLLCGAAAGSEGDGPATWLSVLLLVLGLLLVGLAVKQWRGRPGAGQQAAVLLVFVLR